MEESKQIEQPSGAFAEDATFQSKPERTTRRQVAIQALGKVLASVCSGEITSFTLSYVVGVKETESLLCYSHRDAMALLGALHMAMSDIADAAKDRTKA